MRESLKELASHFKDFVTSPGSTLPKTLRLTKAVKSVGNASMQRKLTAYWASLLLIVFAAFILLASVLGLFSTDENNLRRSLSAHHENTVASVNRHANALAAQSISISEESADVLEDLLLLSPVSDLNDDANSLKKAERALMPILKTALESSSCNGAFVVLDATVNTSAQGADSSRAGLLVRYANLNKSDAVNQDLVLYRGMFDVARENGIELHNRWRMEFDTSLMPWYKQALTQKESRLAESFFWTERMPITDTWEESSLIVIPIYSDGGEALGVCGLELSKLFFQLSYPAQSTDYGSMVTVVAPIEDGSLFLERGMLGGLDKTYLSDTDILHVKKGSSFNVYSGESGDYIGLHTPLGARSSSGDELCVATLIPREHFAATAWTRRTMTIAVAALLLAGALVLSSRLSKRFVEPISGVLAAIQAGDSPKDKPTGISEIDAIVSILDAKANDLQKNQLPPDVASLFDEFARRFTGLTATERSIVRLYSEDMDVSSVAETMFISIHTVRKHNANIYRKLDVNSREELVLYLELFRRCGQLDELLESPTPPERQPRKEALLKLSILP